jgi:hypothetical protein
MGTGEKLLATMGKTPVFWKARNEEFKGRNTE